MTDVRRSSHLPTLDPPTSHAVNDPRYRRADAKNYSCRYGPDTRSNEELDCVVAHLLACNCSSVQHPSSVSVSNA
jgi:hypothetical protein